MATVGVQEVVRAERISGQGLRGGFTEAVTSELGLKDEYGSARVKMEGARDLLPSSHRELECKSAKPMCFKVLMLVYNLGILGLEGGR